MVKFRDHLAYLITSLSPILTQHIHPKSGSSSHVVQAINSHLTPYIQLYYANDSFFFLTHSTRFACINKYIAGAQIEIMTFINNTDQGCQIVVAPFSTIADDCANMRLLLLACAL